MRVDGSTLFARAGYCGQDRPVMLNDNPASPDAPLPEDAETVGRAHCIARGLG